MERVAGEAGRGSGVEVAISREPVIAGTGGALREARSLLGDAGAIVVWNGDVLFDLDLAGVVAAHRASGALATMVLAPMPPGATYATVDVDRSMAVRRIAGQRTRAARTSSPCTSPASTSSPPRFSTGSRTSPSPAT